MTRLDATFRRTRKAGRAALIGYLPAGYPDIETSIEALRTLSWHVDVLEVGLPYGFSDHVRDRIAGDLR